MQNNPIEKTIMATTNNLISFASINVNGLGKPGKRSRVFAGLELLNCDVYFIQETHLNSSNLVAQYAAEWKGQSVWSVSPHRASKGVAVLLKNQLNIKILNTVHDPEEDTVL